MTNTIIGPTINCSDASPKSNLYATQRCMFVKRFLFYGRAWSKSSLKDKWLVPCRLPAIKVEQNGQNKELEPTQLMQAKAQSCKRSPYVSLSLKYANSHAYKLQREPAELCCLSFCKASSNSVGLARLNWTERDCQTHKNGWTLLWIILSVQFRPSDIRTVPMYGCMASIWQMMMMNYKNYYI